MQQNANYKGMFFNFQKRKRGTWDYDKFFKLNLQTCQIAQIKKRRLIYFGTKMVHQQTKGNFYMGLLMIRTWRGVITIFSIIYFVALCGSSIEMGLCPKTTIIAMLWDLPLLRLINSLFGFQLRTSQKQNWSPWKKFK